jgi:hypothetical protein
MAANKIKFKMSVEKIQFEFEGDYEQGRAMQQGITQTLTNLSNLQNRVLGAEAAPKQITSNVVDPPRPRRRKRRTIGDGAAAAENGNGNGSTGGEGEDGDGERRSRGVSPTAVVLEIRKAGFFAEPRTSGEVLTECHRRGFSNLRASDLTSPLGSLTRQDVLRRDNDPTRNQWAYTNGTKDEPDRG